MATFFALATTGTTTTYRATVTTADSKGQPVQVTTTQRPPDARFDVFNADGTVDSTFTIGGQHYQCTMTSSHWDCGELGSALPPGTVFDPAAVQQAVDSFRQRASDYDFRVEDRQLVGVTARCLVTTRKPGHEQDASLAPSATLCLSPEGALLAVEGPSGAITATAYTTTIPADAFALPAPVTPSTTVSSSAPTTAN